jgi:hypothetical protein
MRFEHRFDTIPEGQIGITDDACGDLGRAIPATGAHRRDSGDELGLADRAHFRSTLRAVHRTAFEKDRRHNVVPGVEIGEELFEQVAMVRAIRWPKVMMGVNDRQLRIEDWFSGLPRQPGFVRRLNAPPELRRLIGCRHACPPRMAKVPYVRCTRKRGLRGPGR